MYGPVRTVVWQGSAGDRRPYADQTGFEEIKARPTQPPRFQQARGTKVQYFEFLLLCVLSNLGLSRLRRLGFRG